MFRKWMGMALLVTLAAQAVAQQTPAPRFNGMFQIDLAAGGDDLRNAEIHASQTNLGQGVTFSFGATYRPVESSRLELQGIVGYKVGVPVPDDEEANVTRWVLQLLANYPLEDKWYVGGGLAFHVNPKYVDDFPGALDVDFDDALGVTIEGGWSWMGLQCTWMEYRSPYGKFGANNCGVRFTWRFHERP